ncbi:MAG: phospholipase, partial [Actinobacteria bacterium]|nr:phospholipase [Actinomycetota bacterium]
HPVGVLADWARRDRRRADRLPDQLPDPPPCGTHAVQILRTYPYRRPSYPFAPAGERSIALAYRKALTNAQQLIYVEDQYLWSAQIAEQFAEALRRAPQLRLVAVVPRYPDQDGALSLAPSAAGQGQALEVLLQAGGERVTVYNLENAAGTPIYVHAKVCIIDDTWVNIGSDNFNQRSWTHDSELACAIIDTATDSAADTAAGSGAGGFARTLRLQLAAEHLESDSSDTAQLVDPVSFSAAFTRAAAELDRWYDIGQTGARPPGRRRRHDPPRLAPATRLWAGQVYRTFFDPDGRPTSLRRAGRH